jgi:hypothetical protein
LAAGAALALTYASGVGGHHSFGAVFDREQPVELTGTVTSVEWTNPHVWFSIDVERERGETERWSFEMGSPNALIRRGWAQDSLPAGTRVTVHGARARDGSRKAAALSITRANGETVFGARYPSGARN